MTDRFGHILADEAQNRFVFMKYRIHKILLVCCSYDGYILEEDGHIEQQINRGVPRSEHVEPAPPSRG